MDPQLQSIQSQNLQNHGSHALHAQGGGAKISHQGMNLQIKSAASSIADIAEEIGSAISEKAKEKSLDKRSALHEIRKTQAMERAENYLKNVADVEKQEKLKNYLLDMDKHTSAKGLKEWLSGFSSDHSEEYSALEVIKQNAAQTGNKALENQALALQQQLMEKHGEHIRAGFNVVDTAELFNGKDGAEQSLASSRELVSGYQDTVLDYGGVARTFSKIIEEHGEEKFPMALDFLRQALGADLAAQNSSVAKERLEAIVGDIKDIFTLKTLLDMSNGLVNRLQNDYGEARAKIGQELMGGMLKLTEAKWVSQRDLSSLAQDMDIKQLATEIYFGHRISAIFAKLPPTVFADDNTRNALLETAMSYVHELVDKEEE
ncbi:type III secretion system gatekeeper subunit SctW [Thalassomonas haliotis]|uniref:Type III secretion system gatekeeper subunit SctW n=1 Tax=Thalassomonas haliotis TaxID=485448 RepID=A0ABY7V6W7_9GAMM|nr:type III secretion system gatekeeper subunit SctW [Thalassomonas haliotis]WDE09438.1 type III secretion system gatekeeper subunit SctW [Thalassomonas haliotis]